MQQQFGDIAKDKKFRLNNRTSPRPNKADNIRNSILTSTNNNNSLSKNSVYSNHSNMNTRINRSNSVGQPFTSMKSSLIQSNVDINKVQKDRRQVRFSQTISNSSKARKKHHSSSILKKSRYSSSVDKRIKTRSDSVNSMAGQNPHRDDQSCENINLNRMIKEEYLTILDSYGKKGNHVDDIFPPVVSSLFSYAARKKRKLPELKWKRISDLFPDNQLVMWSSDPSKIMIKASSNLIPQYFVLAMNCIKSCKNLLRFMFESQLPNPQGVYYVKIFQGNMWKHIIIDDFIPAIQEEEINIKKMENPIKIYKPAFLTVISNGSSINSVKNNKTPQVLDIWPFLLQKAFAKLYSSYQALQYGNIYDFLEQLTNKPYQYIELKLKHDNLKQKLLKNQDSSIAFAQTQKQNRYALQLGIGNSDKVSFSLQNKQKKIVRPQQLSEHFQGLYLYGGINWTYTGYCPVRQVRQSISVRYFQMKSSSNCSLSLYQKDERYFQQNFKYQYCWIRLMLLQKQNMGYRWIDGRYDNLKSLSIETHLQIGQYYVIIMPEWQKKSYDLNLIIRTKVPTRLQRKIYQQGMIEQACTDLAQRFGKLNQHNAYICSYNCIHQSMGFIIENINNQRMKGHIRIVRSIQGLQCSQQIEAINKQFKPNKSIEVKIKSGQHFTVVLIMKKGVDQNFFKNFDFQGQ